MQIKSHANNTYLSIRDDYNKIRNEQIFIIAKSGYGKSLAGAGIVEKLHKAGYIVLVIADPKDELEYCYQMFEPREQYHLDHLKKIGRRPSKKDVKIYHPFTFNIDKGMLPDINFYTFSLKDLGRKEWGLLAETGWDTETMKLLLQASNNITKEDGLYGILHSIQNAISGKKDGRTRKADPKNFYLEASSGTMKAITEISNYLQPFRRDYFLAKDSCPLKINWKDILTDQKHYHVFISNWIKDEKLKDFIVLALLNGIRENKKFLKKPIVVVIPEIRKQCPFRPEGHKKFLAISFKDSLSIMRSSGRGMTTISDSQVFSGVDEEVRNSATTTLLGEIGGGADMEKIAKAYNYRREIRDQLKKMDYKNSYLIVGKEDLGGITIFFPSSCHAEPHYNFFEMYREEYRNKTKLYDSTIQMMKNILKEEETKFKDKIKKREKEAKEKKEKIREEKEESQSKSKKTDEKMEKAKDIETKSKLQMMKLCYEMKNDSNLDDKERTLRKVGHKFGLNHITVKKYCEEYSKVLEKENSEDFEEKVIGDLNQDEN